MIPGSLKRFKNDEKCFLFHVKALFLLKIFEFLLWLFGRVGKGLDIPRSKGNKAMKLDQLIEYSVTIICLQKSCRKCDRETSICFFKRLYIRSKLVGSNLNFNIFS